MVIPQQIVVIPHYNNQAEAERSYLELIAWFLAFGFGGLYFSTTKADIVDIHPPDIYTLEYFTTALGATTFSFAFERMADQLCPHGYVIIDKTNKDDEAATNRTRWLISCKNPVMKEP